MNCFKFYLNLQWFLNSKLNICFQTYFLEFDGASKGNPGLAGAGAIIRANDGSTVGKLSNLHTFLKFSFIFYFPAAA